MSTEITGIDGDLARRQDRHCRQPLQRPRSATPWSKGRWKRLTEAGFDADRIPVVRVPGAWELPTVVRQVIDAETRDRCDCAGLRDQGRNDS